MVQGPGGVGHVGTLDQHPLEDGLDLRALRLLQFRPLYRGSLALPAPGQGGREDEERRLQSLAIPPQLSLPLVYGKSSVVLPECCAELVDMYKVFAHVGGQDHIYQPLPEDLVGFRVQVLEDVDPLIRVGQLEAQCRVVVLQDGRVVVQDGQVAPRVAEEGGVPAGVVHVVDDGSDQADGFVNSVQQGLDGLLLKEVGGGLHHVCCMAERGDLSHHATALV